MLEKQKQKDSNNQNSDTNGNLREDTNLSNN